MADFEMCAACRAEYLDPNDRRYHAQPISCHQCGPRLHLYDADATPLAVSTEEALRIVRDDLAAGRIVAVKGVGGVHLACDATDQAAVLRLRERKCRPHKPFAVMAADVRTAAEVVEIPATAEACLSGPARPIVLLRRRPGVRVAVAVAPGLDELGVMLPYTPLHHLLFDGPPHTHPAGATEGPRVLVMTSGNTSGEPLCHTDHDALTRLQGVADRYLLHDRVIHLACDDSVVALDEGGELPVRRSRGYAPLPIALPSRGVTGVDAQGAAEPAGEMDGGEDGPAEPTVFAAGAELKGTFTLARDGFAFVSGHLGDLAGLRSRVGYDDAVAQALRFHRQAPSLIIADRHPGYASRARAEQLAEEYSAPLVEVQHHHAHLAALAAEHGRLNDPLLGLVFDGTGYGCDSTIWGGELLLLLDGGVRAERLGHLGALPLPGGDAGVRNPVRTAAAALIATGVGIRSESPVAQALTTAERATITAMVGSGRCPTTSSVGRLFDVVSSMLGVRHRISYEAQAAIELETLARRWTGPVPVLRIPVLDGRLQPAELLAGLDEGLAAGTRVEALAAGFHRALAEGAAQLAARECRRHGLTTVGLTGGVFVNRVLLRLLRDTLQRGGFEVLTHRLVPPNDGGLSLGQAAIGTQLLARSKPQGG
jgi:hydrogenase maturation protein HypF